MPWKPTYDTHDTREAAIKDAQRRRQQARTGRTFRVVKRGDKYTVEYKEKG